MLKKVNEKQNVRLSADELPHVRIADANFPAPFRSGLEYSSPAPARGTLYTPGCSFPDRTRYMCAARAACAE